MSESLLYKYFQDLCIDHEIVEHKAFFTCEDSGNFYADKNLGVDCKNLFLRDRKGNQHYLIVLQSHRQLNIPALASFLDIHPKMSFASSERLYKYLGVTPGSVTPFGLIYDIDKSVKVIFDSSIRQHDKIHFHPLRNTATVSLKTTELIRWVKHLGYNIKWWEMD